MTIDIHFSEEELKTNSILIEALRMVLFENKENTKIVKNYTSQTLDVRQDIPIVLDEEQGTGAIQTTYTIDDLRKASSKIMMEKGREVVADLIKTVGSSKLTDIPIDKYDVFMEKLKEIA